MKLLLKFALGVGVLLLSTSILWSQPRLRPVQWAQPVIGTTLKNWFRVDHKLYRSEQPNSKEMRILAETGIINILNLRGAASGRR